MGQEDFLISGDSCGPLPGAQLDGGCNRGTPFYDVL